MRKIWKKIKIKEAVLDIVLTNKKVKQRDYLITGRFPVVDQGKNLIGGYNNDLSLMLNCGLPVIVFGDHTKVIKFIDFKFIAGADGIKVLKPKENLFNPKLFYYFLHCIQFPDKGYARHFQHLAKQSIPVPPITEQHQIVEKLEELFSELDKGIKSLRQAKEQIKTYRQAVLKYAFEGKLLKLSDIDLKMVAEPKASYNANTNFPEGWKWVKLGDVTEKITTAKREDPEKEFFYLDIGGIESITNTIESFKSYKWKNAPSRARQIVKSGDTLFSTVRTYLKKIATVTDRFDNHIASTGFCVIRPKHGVLDSSYIFLLTLYDKFLEPLNALQTGSSYPAVRDGDVFNQIIPLPPIKEQKQIVQEIERRFSEADNMEKTIDQSLQQAEALRQSILKTAFEGKLVKI